MSDLTLYPIRGQVAQVNGRNEYIIYVPRADKYTYGTVKIGDGLNVVDGVVSVDAENVATIKTIAKNGTNLVPDINKRVNIEITKADVGLNNVNNTADLDKPVSTATQQAIDEVISSVSTTQNDLDDYKLVVNNKFLEQKSDVDGRLLVINNTISQNKTATDSAIQRIEEVLEGKEQAVAFTNYQAVVNDFNNAATNKYNVGQSVYVQSVNVPDLWVYSIENTHVDFAYVGDEDIVETLETTGTVQFGYYRLAMMETKTASVANAVTLDTNQTITNTKTFEIDKTWSKFDKDLVTLQYNGDTRISAIIVNTKVQIGSMDNDGTLFRGLEHNPTTKETNFTGTLKYNGVEVLHKNAIVDSDSIIVGSDGNNIKFELANTINNKISKALVTPMTAPSATQLVAIDDGNSQTMIDIGDGLLLENGTLKATGGGGEFVETDPTVPAWAKNATKPSYTASEVGAVASTNGTASNLNVTNFTITGALISGVSNGIWVSSDSQNFRIQNPSTFISVNKIEKNTNKTTAISNASTNTQYPSAKAVYDYVQSAMQNAIQDTWEASY